MTGPVSVEEVARDFAQRIDERDWDGLAALLAPSCRVEFRHDGSVFDRDGWVAFNAGYPAVVRFVAEDVVAADDRAVLRAHCFNDDVSLYVACFLTVTGGLVTELVEVWTDDTTATEETS